ncbi:MAG: hypothetical protein IPK76_19015 [Lewinellaceae bacterium]|nr:hypothetical protein [Lewinellaceae bacterium]
MKIVFTLLLCASCAYSGFSQNTGNVSSSCLLRLDSVFESFFDAGVADYRHTRRTFYSYDSLDRNTVIVEQRSQDATPFIVENYTRDLYEYPASNQKSIRRQLWDTLQGQWNDYHYTLITNTPDGALLETLSQLWDTTGLQWINNNLSVNNYYPGGTVQSWTSLAWNAASNAWDTLDVILYAATGQTLYRKRTAFDQLINTYSGSGLLEEFKRIRWDNATQSWVNDFRFQYTYNGQGRLVETLRQQWDIPTVAWNNSSRIVNSYINNWALPDTSLQLTWQSSMSDWRPLSITTYAIQGDTHRLEVFNWNILLAIWRYQYRYDSIFNPNGQLSARFEYKGNAQTYLSWVQHKRYLIGYNALQQLAYRDQYIWDPSISQWLTYENRTLEYFPDSALQKQVVIYRFPSVINPGFPLPPLRVTEWYEPRPPHPIQYVYTDTLKNFGAVWNPSGLDVYYYAECAGAVSSVSDKKTPPFSCFLPNPFYPGSSITCENIDPDAMIDLEVFDLAGRLLTRQHTWPGHVSLPGITAGLHAVQVRQNGRLLFSGLLYFAEG